MVAIDGEIVERFVDLHISDFVTLFDFVEDDSSDKLWDIVVISNNSNLLANKIEITKLIKISPIAPSAEYKQIIVLCHILFLY